MTAGRPTCAASVTATLPAIPDAAAWIIRTRFSDASKLGWSGIRPAYGLDMSTEPVTTVGAFTELLREHGVPDDARLIGEGTAGMSGADVFVTEIKLRASGQSTVVLRIGAPYVLQR
jgi:hypothetical protein